MNKITTFAAHKKWAFYSTAFWCNGVWKIQTE